LKRSDFFFVVGGGLKGRVGRWSVSGCRCDLRDLFGWVTRQTAVSEGGGDNQTTR
jgi:hypothetical protein